MENRRVLATGALAIAALLVLGTGALAQGYPAKPVRLIVPLAAGGGVDTVARTLAQKYSELWQQQVVVENRPGAGGNIGADFVAKSPPDGYTLLMNPSGQAIAPSLYRKLPFDPRKDFAPITEITLTNFILVTDPKLPVASVRDLIALATARPGKLNYGSAGMGSATHLAGELLRTSAGIDIVHVPYKGDANVVPAILSGEVQMGFFPLSSVLQLMKDGRVRAIGMSGLARAKAVPQVPTIAESGIPGFEYAIWIGIFAPAGTPREILAKVSADGARILRLPDVREKMESWGYENPATTPEEFTARYLSDIDKYARIIRSAGVPPID